MASREIVTHSYEETIRAAKEGDEFFDGPAGLFTAPAPQSEKRVNPGRDGDGEEARYQRRDRRRRFEARPK